MRGVKTGRLQNCWVCAWPRVSAVCTCLATPFRPRAGLSRRLLGQLTGRRSYWRSDGGFLTRTHLATRKSRPFACMGPHAASSHACAALRS